jgi:chorismate mutase/prephenate dehydrogenase
VVSLDDIDHLRKRIAAVDQKLMETLAEREAVASRIGMHKLENGLPIRNLEVEEMVVERFQALAEEMSIEPRTARDLARLVIKDAVEVQSWIMRPLDTRRVLVVGGAGKMGSWLSTYFNARGHHVRILDPQGPNGEVGSLEEGVGWAEIVVVCTPVSVTEGVLREILDLGPSGLVFDIASIKGPIMDTLREAASRGLKVCSIHPMFGPDVPSLYDRNVLVCDCGSQPAVEEAVELFDGTGAMVLEIEVEEHDELMSFVLGLSHAVSLAFFKALSDSGIDYGTLERSGSTTFRKQMDTSRDVAFENPELYYDIQNKNPQAGRALLLLEQAVAEVRRSAVLGDKEGFIEIMDRGKRYFGGME